MVHDSRQAGGTECDEIEITLEMSKAGQWAYVSHDPERFSLEEIIASIWAAMFVVKSKEACGPHRPHLDLDES